MRSADDVVQPGVPTDVELLVAEAKIGEQVASRSSSSLGMEREPAQARDREPERARHVGGRAEQRKLTLCEFLNQRAEVGETAGHAAAPDR